MSGRKSNSYKRHSYKIELLSGKNKAGFYEFYWTGYDHKRLLKMKPRELINLTIKVKKLGKKRRQTRRGSPVADFRYDWKGIK